MRNATTNYTTGEHLIPLASQLASNSRTPAVPCMLAGQASKPRIKVVTKTVNVAIGRTTGMPVPCEYWATTDTEVDYGHGYEACYDPKRITLADAEKWVRTQLTEQGVNVGRFINEDEPSDGAREQIERVIAVLPDVIDQSMKTALPHRYTPELAAEFAETMAAILRGEQPDSSTACPDGVAWCEGDPLNHNDTDDHRHEGPEHKLNGSYLCDPASGGIAAFQMAQWPDGEPHLVFQGSGLWADINLDQTRELKRDLTAHLIRLNATERHLAILLNPGKTPFEETDDEQLSDGAVGVALDAIQVALEKSGNRAMTMRALRNFLDMTEDEQA